MNERLKLIYNKHKVIPNLSSLMDVKELLGNKTFIGKIKEGYTKNKSIYYNEALALLSLKLRTLGERSELLVGGKTSLGHFDYNFIAPWQSISPITLNILKKDLYKNGLLFKNTTLKYILNKNLCQLNFILFLDRLKEITFIKPTLNQIISPGLHLKLGVRDQENPKDRLLETDLLITKGLDIDLLTILVTKNINVYPILYNLYDSINGKDDWISKANLLTNSYLDKLFHIDLSKMVPNSYQSLFLDKDGLSCFKNKGGELFNSNKPFKPNVIESNTSLSVGEIYKNKATLEKIAGILTLSNTNNNEPIQTNTTTYRKEDREIDNPISKRALSPNKGLVSYNKKLFKKLLVFLKFLFNKEIELDLTRIQNPYNETHILNQILGEVIKYKSSHFYKLTQIIRENIPIKPKFVSKTNTNTNTNTNQNNYQITSIFKETNNEFAYNYLPFFLYSLLYLNPQTYQADQSAKVNLNSHFVGSGFVQSDPLQKLSDQLSLGKDCIVRKEPQIIQAKSFKIPSLFNLDLDYTISSYNLLALDKWLNLNQLNKQKKIDKTVFSDLHTRGANLKNSQLVTKNEESVIDTKITEERKLLSKKWSPIEEEKCHYINWRNLRNNFSVYITPKVTPSDNLNTQLTKTKYPSKDSRTNNNESKISVNLSIHQQSKWKKIHSMMTYIMQAKTAPLFTATLSNKDTSSPMAMPLQRNTSINVKKVIPNLVHSNISGIRLKLGGRLEKTPIIPRKSSEEVLIGNMSRRSTSFKNTSKLTYKNNKGAYSITVSTSFYNHTNPFTYKS